MTSLEIAEQTWKEHSHVMRDIRNMLYELGIDESKFGSIYLDSYGREQKCFRLDKRRVQVLIMWYEAKLCDKVLDYIETLENKKPLSLQEMTLLVIEGQKKEIEEMKEKIEGLYFQTYKEGEDNVVIIGPIPGDQYQEIVFPVLSPNPETDKNIRYGKYAVHVGGNRGRGQLYPTGDRTNNNIYNASATGTISQIAKDEEGSYQVSITTDAGETVVDTILAGPELIVSQGDAVKAGDALTINPNVGGFGQADTEIVLQSAARIKWLMLFFTGIMLSQVLLVLKKKQVEKVQAAEMNF